MKKLFSKESLKKSLPWLFVLLGITFIALARGNYKNSFWNTFFEKLSDALLVGGILGFLVNAARFMGLFKQELEDILYGKDYLGTRKDLVDVWTNLSLHLFKEKFPLINKELVSSIKQAYLSEDNIYYKDYDYTIQVEWEDKAEKKVKITESMFFYVISDTKGKIPLNFDCNTFVRDEESSASCCKELLFEVDGKPATPVVHDSKYYEDTKTYHFSSSCEVSGKNKYEICYKREKKYSLSDDTDCSFYARHLIYNMQVKIACPDDLIMYYRERGTIKSFKQAPTAKGLVQLKYTGVILRKQGIVVVFIP